MNCQNPDLLKILLFADYIINILKIVVPIVLIILVSVDIAKMIFSGESDIKKIGQKIMNRMVAAIIVFFVPIIVGFVLNLLGDFAPVIDECRSNANVKTIKLLEELAQQKDDDEPDPTPDPEDKTEETIKVATFNIHRGYYGGTTPNIIGNLFKTKDYDYVGLQESWSDSTSKKIANSSDMKYFFSKSTAGVTILVRGSIESKKDYDLPKCGDHELRKLQKVVMKVNKKNISFYNIHLTPDMPSKSCTKTQFKAAAKIIKEDSNPMVLLGDFNVGVSCNIISDALGDNYSVIAYDTLQSGVKCTDSIAISKNKGISVTSTKTIKERGDLSDSHNLVSATLKIK